MALCAQRIPTLNEHEVPLPSRLRGAAEYVRMDAVRISSSDANGVAEHIYLDADSNKHVT